MQRAYDTPAQRREAGFTLVELLVAMVISLVVIFAVLTTLDTFSRNAAQQTRVTDANDQVRAMMDRVVTDLRQAATIEVADRDDLVYTVVDSATQTRRERICLSPSKQLWRSSARGSPPAALPPGSVCPNPGATQITPLKALGSLGSPTNPMFRYDSGSPASVRSIGITVALNAGNAGRTDISTLRASAFVRSRGETGSAVGDDDLTATCNSAGQPTLTLSSSVGPLDVQYTDIDGNSLGTADAGSHLTLSGASGTILANVTSSAGLVSQLVKVISC